MKAARGFRFFVFWFYARAQCWLRRSVVGQSALLGAVLFSNTACGVMWANLSYNQPSSGFLGYLVSSWSFVDGDAPTGLNINTSNYALNFSLTPVNGNLYAVWNENTAGTAGTYEVRAFVYNGNQSWSAIDGGVSAIGLNYNHANGAASSVSTAVNGVLYAAWSELDSGANIRVSIYNGGSSWSLIDGNTAGGINYNAASAGDNPHLAAFNNQLYATWTENAPGPYVIRVKRYNGTPGNWTFIDGGTANGINQNQANWADNPYLAVYNSQLYAAWQENSSGGIEQIRVAQYAGGSTWNFVDGGAGTGINYNTAKGAYTPQLASCQGNLFAAWNEDNGVNSQLRVARYNGGSSWTFIDGNGVNGFNHNPSQYAAGQRLVCFGSFLYLNWDENNAGVGQLRVSAYNGSQWFSLDGNGATGINYNSTAPVGYNGIAVLGTTLYLGWSELVGGEGNIRITVGH